MKQNKEEKKPLITEKNYKALRVAIFCVFAAVIFVLGASFLKGIDFFGKKTYYYAVFDDLGGLQPESAVTVNGYKVGKVTSLDLLSDRPVKIVAEILVNKDIFIPEDSYLEVASKDILGGLAVNIVLGESNVPAKNNDTLTAAIAPSMTAGLGNMLVKLDNILSSIDTVGVVFKDLFTVDGGDKNLKNTLQNIEEITANLAGVLDDNRLNVKRLVDDISVFSHTLKDATPQLKHVIENFDALADTLAKADIAAVITNANASLEQIKEITEKINKGDGDVGQLLNNESIYKNLEASTANLNLLIKDIKENPKKYVTITIFGGKNKEKKKESTK